MAQEKEKKEVKTAEPAKQQPVTKLASEEPKKSKTGLIVGVVLGCCLGIVIIVVLIFVLVGAGVKKAVDNAPGTIKNVSPEKVAEMNKKMKVSNIKVTDAFDNYLEVKGEITNNDTEKHKFVSIKMTFLKGGKTLGVVEDSVTDIEAGQKQDFSSLTTEKITGYDDVKIEVEVAASLDNL